MNSRQILLLGLILNLAQAQLNSSGVFCQTNDLCVETTYCCSGFSCVHPSICLHGQKVTNDYCEYNFECLSRCCNAQVCSHFLSCHQSCTSNQDCSQTSACCSEGYCTQEIVCEGNKVTNDYCDSDQECLSNYCDPDTNTCIMQHLKNALPWQSIVAIVFIVIFLCLLATLFYAAKKLQKRRQEMIYLENGAYLIDQSGNDTSGYQKQKINRSNGSNSIETDEMMYHSEKDIKMSLGKLIDEGTTRRLKFTGTNRRTDENMTFQEKYKDQVSPITENSGEQENTLESFQKGVMSNKDSLMSVRTYQSLSDCASSPISSARNQETSNKIIRSARSKSSGDNQFRLHD